MFTPRSVQRQKTRRPEIKAHHKKATSSHNKQLTAKLKHSKDKMLEFSRPSLAPKSCAELWNNLEKITKSDNSYSPPVSTPDRQEDINSSDNEDDPVIELSLNQRFPRPGEPVCVMCGRFGAYICDKTDKDVCSIECKEKHLRKMDLTDVTLEKASHNDEILLAKSPTETEEDNVENLAQFFREAYLSSFQYKEHPTILILSNEKILFLKQKLEIRTKGQNIPLPILEFSHCALPSTLSENLHLNGYLSPTPVQMQTIPTVLSGHNGLVCAQTGTGKTASFLLPLITRIYYVLDSLPAENRLFKIPISVILAPTRELCIQIEEQTKMLCKGIKHMKTALIIGGLPLPQQLYRLKQGVQIVVATPGRLNDILESHCETLTPEFVQICVLDEVDTMLQKGFQGQVESILDALQDDCQKLMFSATIPPSVETIAKKYMKTPVYISVGPPSTPNKSVKQIILWTEESSKKRRLFDIINNQRHFDPPIVIFVDSKLGADFLADAVEKVCKVTCRSIHGDKRQVERKMILDDFLNGCFEVLVATSLLGRGIDLLNVKMVVNFDMPSTIEEYIHQVGRAGRLETNGLAISFINNNNKNIFLDLVETLEASEVQPPPELKNSPYIQHQIEKRTLSKKKQNRKRKGDELVTTGNLMDLLKESASRRKR